MGVIPSSPAAFSSTVRVWFTRRIAFPSGALPEIVEHGQTGLIVRDVQEMAEAIHAATRIEPAACRAAAQKRFPLERTMERYFALYRELAQHGWGRQRSCRACAATFDCG